MQAVIFVGFRGFLCQAFLAESVETRDENYDRALLPDGVGERAFWLAYTLDPFARGLDAHVSSFICTFSRLNKDTRRRTSLQCRRFPCVLKSSRFLAMLVSKKWGEGVWKVGIRKVFFLPLPISRYFSFSLTPTWMLFRLSPSLFQDGSRLINKMHSTKYDFRRWDKQQTIE